MSTETLPSQNQAMLEEVGDLFAESGFGLPEVFGVAPGRVNVIGEHIDYNGGLVLPAAIDRWVNVAIRRRDDHLVRLVSAQAPGEVVEFSVNEDLAPEGKSWGNYVKGVITGLKAAGFEVPGFEAAVISTVPVGGGLSSSAALEAVFGKVILTLIGAEMDSLELAKLCQKAEHDFAGVPCGLMDQAAVILCEEGKLLMLDCVDDSFQHAPFDDPDWGLLIINSCVSHELSDGGYAVRRDGCHAAARILGVGTLREIEPANVEEVLENAKLTEDMRRYVRHAVTEIARTQETVEALGLRDYYRAGKLLNASHVSLRDDYRVSCPELDFISELAQSQEGVAGCRMTGGGFGGSAIALVRRDSVGSLTSLIEQRYRAEFGIDPKIFETRPMGGTRAWKA
ncbi:galactokinase [Pelagicoccus sp. SDUM812002]|uniref:galactokinase n=1 Tax=Pelagicoccus sp. SDUM812002 TaxID=3041266 RepID=UPI0028105972|nr:galactokinase [Pelagicoccus sp. SDUM812002]MDQ8185661.1 galactokinase [Pelagicoccus sp. SDUM812002]